MNGATHGAGEHRRGYRPDVDGLRAVAVLLVVLFHFQLGAAGGFVGVDVFFVISGYLITGLVQKDLDAGRPLFREFWSRRAIRILPALVAMVLVVLVAGWFLFLPADLGALGESAIAQSAMIPNFYFWKSFGYFSAPTDTKTLLHTWSLGVEEQFYLFLPLALFAIRAVAVERRRLLLALAFAASLALAIYGVGHHRSATFYLLPTRAWELLLGSLLSTLPRGSGPRAWLAEGLSWSGLAAMIWSAFAYDSATPFPGAAALVPCVGAALVIQCNSDRLTRSGRLLASAPVVAIGLISYSLYLWHWPVFVYSNYWRTEPLDIAGRIALAAGAILLAYLSWRFIETPMRRRAAWPSYRAIFLFAVAGLGSLAATGFMLVAGKGFPARVPADAVTLAAGARDVGTLQNVELAEILRGKLYPVGRRETGPVDLLLWGDSHAMMLEPLLAEQADACGLRIAGAHFAATAPLLGFRSKSPYSMQERSSEYNAAVLRYVRSRKVPVVLLAAAWNGYIDDHITSDPAAREAVKRNFRRDMLATVQALRSAGARVWIMEMVPIYRFDVPRKLAGDAFFGRPIATEGKTLADHRAQTAFEASVLRDAKAAGAILLDPTSYLCESGSCRISGQGRALYADNNHLTITGLRLLAPMFEPLVREAARPTGGQGASRCPIQPGHAGNDVAR